MGVRIIGQRAALAVLLCVLPSACGWHLRSHPPHPKPTKRSVVMPTPVAARVTAIDLSSFVSLREQGRVQVYDVRPSWYFALGHIPGAECLPGRSVEVAFAEKEDAMREALAAQRVSVVDCTDRDCQDGETVAGWLAKKGISSSVLSGGWDDWKAAGLPTD